MVNIEQLQIEHYNKISAKYSAHYGDATSQAYRLQFMNAPMFKNINLSEMNVLEAMCGNGQTTDYLLEQGALVTGLDISNYEIHDFKSKRKNCRVVQGSILSTSFEDNVFDCVVITGGIHHTHPHVNKAIYEVYRILKPNGYFCFIEPHEDSFPDVIRKIWYRHDPLFAENEASIDVEKLKQEFVDKFQINEEIYHGNIAYLFVYSSLIFRIPLSIKPFYAPFLLSLESVINKFQGKNTACFVVCQWQKISVDYPNLAIN